MKSIKNNLKLWFLVILTLLYSSSAFAATSIEMTTADWINIFGNINMSYNNIMNIGNASISGNLSVGGNLSVDGTTFFVDAESDRVGIGTASPATALEIDGTLTVTQINAHTLGGTLTLNGQEFDAGSSLFTIVGTNSQVLEIRDNREDTNPAAFQTYAYSTSPAVDDFFGAWYVYGEDNAAEKTQYANINVQAVNVIDTTETAKLNINLMNAGTLNLAMDLSGSGTLWLDDELHVDGNVGIGTTTPGEKLTVIGNVNVSKDVKAGNFTIDGQAGSLYQPVYGSDDDLVLYLPFSEDSVDTSTQFDRSPYGNDGTLNNGVICNSTAINTSTGRYGGSCYFDGVDDIVTVADGSGIQNIWDGGGTAEVWFNKKSGDANGDILELVSKNWGGWTFWIRGSYISFYKYFDTAYSRWDSDAGAFPDNEWHHLVITYDADSVANNPQFYKNGVAITTSKMAGGSGTRTSDVGMNLFIGRYGASATYQFNGSIDEVKLYKRVLTPEEIRTHYLRGKGFGASGAITANEFRIVNTSGNVDFIKDSAGRVGIGTASPTATLTLESGGIINSLGEIRVQSGGTNTNLYLDSSGAGDVLINYDTGPSGDDLKFYGGDSEVDFIADAGTGGGYFRGNVGIGTTDPQYKLQVADTTTTAVNLSNTLYVDGSAKMVGIGTISPSHTLQVEGTFNATTSGGGIIVDSDGNVKIGI